MLLENSPDIYVNNKWKVSKNNTIVPYLREYNSHLFQPNIAFKIGVCIRFKYKLESAIHQQY